MRISALPYSLSALALVLFSCSRESSVSDGKGYLTAAVEQDDNVELVSVKSVTENDPFSLKIYRGSELVTTVDDHRTLISDPLQLNCATYKVCAYNKEVEAATFDTPRYYGEDNIKILADQTITANITCCLDNVLVLPSFAEGFKDYFQSYSFTASNGEGELTWSEANANLDKVGYFSVTGTLKWTLTLVNKAGRTVTLSDEYTTKAKEKYVLNFSVEEESEGGAEYLRVVLDNKLNDRIADFVLDFTSNTNMANISSVNAWAYFAYVSGTWNKDTVPEGLAIQYRKTSESEWTTFSGDITVDASGKSFSAELPLEPSTTYIARGFCTEVAGTKEVQFTTEDAAELHNMGFDYWYTSGKAPMPNYSSDYAVWDSANPGSASFGTIPTNPESDHVAVTGDGKKAAKLESKAAAGIFAAGNIFTGKFGKAITSLSNPGATLDWGTPFSSRPLALKGYLDYNPVDIDYAKSPYTALKGQPDTCQIQIFLTDRTEMYHINTQNKEFVDINGDDIIAYGKIETGTLTSTKSGLVNGYEPFTIKLEYRDLTRKPNMIVIVGAASKYGDYFTGGKGSVLYIDELSFVYDPKEL